MIIDIVFACYSLIWTEMCLLGRLIISLWYHKDRWWWSVNLGLCLSDGLVQLSTIEIKMCTLDSTGQLSAIIADCLVNSVGHVHNDKQCVLQERKREWTITQLQALNQAVLHYPHRVDHYVLPLPPHYHLSHPSHAKIIFQVTQDISVVLLPKLLVPRQLRIPMV